MKSSICKRILILLAVIILGYMLLNIVITHNIIFNNENDTHLFIFKDSVIENLNKPSSSWVSEQDTLTHFIFSENLKNKKDYYEINDTCNNYYIDVWEFKALKNYELDDVFINEHNFIGKSEFPFEGQLDSKSPYPISIKYFYKIDGLNLNLGENTKVIKEIKGENYKGFYGLVDRMSICNKKEEPQIYFNFEKLLTPTVLILYKRYNGIFLIIIHSNKRLDENVIRILNLN